MVVKVEKYVITTKEQPIKFFYQEDFPVDSLESAILRSYEDCIKALGSFSNPDAFKIMKVFATYEI